VIERKEKTMRKGGLLGAVTGLVFVAGFLLTLVAPTELDQPFVGVGTPEAAEIISAAPNGISPGEEIAERDVLDLQLG
jgi:hypothetical protein